MSRAASALAMIASAWIGYGVGIQQPGRVDLPYWTWPVSLAVLIGAMLLDEWTRRRS